MVSKDPLLKANECPNPISGGLTIFQRQFPTELYRFFSVQVCTSNIEKAVGGTKILQSFVDISTEHSSRVGQTDHGCIMFSQSPLTRRHIPHFTQCQAGMKDYAEVGRAEEKMRSVIVVSLTLDSSQGETCLVISGSFELASPSHRHKL